MLGERHKNLSQTKFSAMSGAQMLERLRELRGDTNSLRAQIKRLQGQLARVHQQRADELKRSSKGLAKKALGADAELRRVFGKGGNVEHLLDALAKPRKEGGLSDIEKMCMAASAANLRHKRASSRRYPPGVLAFFSEVSKQGGAKSAVKLLRGPGLVVLKLKKGAVASRGDAKYNLACVPTQQAIRNDDDRCSTDPGYLYGISRKTIELALGFGGPRVPKRLGWDETDGRMTFAGYGSSSKRGEYFKKTDVNMPGFDAKAVVLEARYRELLQPIHNFLQDPSSADAASATVDPYLAAIDAFLREQLPLLEGAVEEKRRVLAGEQARHVKASLKDEVERKTTLNRLVMEFGTLDPKPRTPTPAPQPPNVYIIFLLTLLINSLFSS